MTLTWANKDNFFNAKVPFKQMDVPTIGHIKVFGLTAGEKDDWENNVVRSSGKQQEIKLANARAVLIQKCVRDGQGRHIFTLADIGKITEIPAYIIDPILVVARKLSGMDADEIEDLVKNLFPGPDDQQS